MIYITGAGNRSFNTGMDLSLVLTGSDQGNLAYVRATAVFLGAPPAADKEEFMTHKAQVFKFFGAFAPEALASLVQRVKLSAHA